MLPQILKDTDAVYLSGPLILVSHDSRMILRGAGAHGPLRTFLLAVTTKVSCDLLKPQYKSWGLFLNLAAFKALDFELLVFSYLGPDKDAFDINIRLVNLSPIMTA